MKYIKLSKCNKIYLLPFLLKRFIFLLKTDFYNYLFLTVIFNASFDFYLVINKKFGYFLILKNLNCDKFSLILHKILFCSTEKKKLIFFYSFNKNRNFLQKYTHLVLTQLNLINIKNVKNIIK